VELGRNGAHVLLIARREDKLLETKKMVEEAGGKGEIFVADLTDISQINNLGKVLRGRGLEINILVNVAGIWHGENQAYAGIELEKFENEVIYNTYMVGTVAPTLLAKELITVMPEGSRIVNISGTFSGGAKGWLPYYVSKRAIEDLTVGLSQELVEKEIYVNCISPSDVATEEYKKYFPEYISDAIEPEEIAKYAVKLCDEENKVTGKVIVVKKGKEPFEGFHY